MFDIGDTLLSGLTRARAGLTHDASATALAQTPYGEPRTDAAMAGVAENAVFTEALLNALHSRLAEIKTATHS
jgi:hypothetical protein